MDGEKICMFLITTKIMESRTSSLSGVYQTLLCVLVM